ncbi:MAG: hypothetical protein ACYSUB_01940 [Planctomycetota bacterium]|jgi:hypothetical protein
MNDLPLDKNGLVVFGISHFCCEARDRGDFIEVRVCFNDSHGALLTLKYPVNTTLREIKKRTATELFQELDGMLEAIRLYYINLLPQEEL